jgi:hypothetical protein
MQTVGNPTVAGIACVPSWGGANPQELRAFSWSGVITSFGSDINGYCTLSPHGAVIACPSDIDSDGSGQHTIPAEAFRAGGVVQKLPNPLDLQLIGWLDGNDVVVTTGGSISGNSLWGLAVENIVTGKRIAVSLSNNPDPYAPWQFYGVVPGAL